MNINEISTEQLLHEICQRVGTKSENNIGKAFVVPIGVDGKATVIIGNDDYTALQAMFLDGFEPKDEEAEAE